MELLFWKSKEKDAMCYEILKTGVLKYLDILK
jgi:hypothetical protein